LPPANIAPAEVGAELERGTWRWTKLLLMTRKRADMANGPITPSRHVKKSGARMMGAALNCDEPIALSAQ
jgi:hypothetical protein